MCSAVCSTSLIPRSAEISNKKALMAISWSHKFYWISTDNDRQLINRASLLTSWLFIYKMSRLVCIFSILWNKNLRDPYQDYLFILCASAKISAIDRYIAIRVFKLSSINIKNQVSVGLYWQLMTGIWRDPNLHMIDALKSQSVWCYQSCQSKCSKCLR